VKEYDCKPNLNPKRDLKRDLKQSKIDFEKIEKRKKKKDAKEFKSEKERHCTHKRAQKI